MSALPILVRHIFLDVDGTLVDFVGSLNAGTAAAATTLSEAVGRTISAEAIQDAVHRLATGTGGRRGHSETRLRAYRQLLRERGVDDEAIAITALERDLEARAAALRPYDDAFAVMQELRDRGFVLVAATNGNPALDRTPLQALLHHSWRAEDAGVSKPHPDFFHRALAHVGADPATSVMVGDRLDNDVEPAHSVGMPTILLDRYRDHAEVPPPARALIHTLAELPPLVEPLEA